MAEPVAFLGPEPAVLAAGTVAPNVRAYSRRMMIAGAVWALAAAACVVAALSNLYTYNFIDAVVAPHGGYDAFGNALDSNLAGDRGPRWAIPLWLLAVAFTVLAVVTLRVATVRDRKPAPWAAAAGMISGALLAGVATGIWLFVDSAKATYRALGATLHEKVVVHIGGCPWFATLAILCAVAAVVLTGWRTDAVDVRSMVSRFSPHRTPGPSPEVEADVDAGEELMVRGRRQPPEDPPQIFDI